MATTQIPTLAVLTLAAATLVPTRAECGPEPSARHFGPFGVARGQIARLNLANGGIILPCVAELSFLDAAGRLVVRARHTLAAGEAAFLDVDLTPPPEPDAEATPPRWSRKTLRALVQLSPPPEPDAPSSTCVTTLEIFDGHQRPDAAAAGRTGHDPRRDGAMKALTRALLVVLWFALPAAAQLDPGNYDIRQHGRTVGGIYVPARAEGATAYVEHWVLFRGYVYPSSRTESAIRIRRSQHAYSSEEEFFQRVAWGPGFRYVRIDATDTDVLPGR